MEEVSRARSIVGDSGGNRAEHDFYPTPPEATLALLSKVRFEGRIWEPACGRGDISEVLIKQGYSVVSTDLIDRGYGYGGIDFLTNWSRLAPNIITNPPYKLAQEFAEHALIDLRVDKLCLLLKLAFLEGVERAKFFNLYPPKWVYVFSKRLTMTKNGEEKRSSGMIAFAWYVWERGHLDYPRIGWI